MYPTVQPTPSLPPASAVGAAITGRAPAINIGGILPIIPLHVTQAQRAAEDQTRLQAEQAQPLITELAGYVRRCWTAARMYKDATITPRLDRASRARRGEYDPDVLAELQKQGGGSLVYMMITATKCRGAAALLRETYLGGGSDKPWTVANTPSPDLPPKVMKQAMDEATNELAQMIQSGANPQDDQVRELLIQIKDRINNEQAEAARLRMDRCETKMEDQLDEGGFLDAFSEFIDDLVTFPAAFIKGPVVRRKATLQYDEAGVPNVGTEMLLEWDRVSPYDIFPAPHAARLQDGYLIERHRLTMQDIDELRGVEGYSDLALQQVVEDGWRGGLKNWDYTTTINDARPHYNMLAQTDPEATVSALQFWGAVPGKMLMEWGVASVTDPARMYFAEVWLIKNWVIKATLNTHPLGHKPYFSTSYEQVPGALWGNGVPDLVRDCQTLCNAAARAIANNMGLASGPQVYVTTNRLPVGEDITTMYPWKIWQVTSDPMGNGSAKPIDFFQPQSISGELSMIFDKFATLADEYSGVPKYMTGDSTGGGAGRTASGMSMMITNASKIVKQVVHMIDLHVLTPVLERLYLHDVRYVFDDDMLGDLKIVARGALSMQVKDNAQVRRNEFLATTANPIDIQIVGIEGRANLLREAAKNLGMDPDDIVPSVEVIKARMLGAQQAQQGVPPGAQSQVAQPQPGAQLMDGTPPTNNFAPQALDGGGGQG